MPKVSRRSDVHYPTSVRLRGPILAALDEECKVQQRSRGFLINFILENWLEFNKAQRKKKDKRNESTPI